MEGIELKAPFEPLELQAPDLDDPIEFVEEEDTLSSAIESSEIVDTPGEFLNLDSPPNEAPELIFVEKNSEIGEPGASSKPQLRRPKSLHRKIESCDLYKMGNFVKLYIHQLFGAWILRIHLKEQQRWKQSGVYRS